MPKYAYDRLSAQDNNFLRWERGNVRMHIASTLVCDAGPLRHGDRKRPLWETWVVEGLEGGRFAMITKIHHCMIDGASGVDLAYIQMSTAPEVRELETPPAFHPRPAPSRFELWRDEVARQIGIPFEVVRDFRQFTTDAEDLGQELLTRAKALVNTLGMGTSADESPINGRVGPHRRFDWLSCRVDDLKAVRKAWNCTINDVVLTIVTGAVREYLQSRRVDPASIEFRVSSPVSIRKEEERGKLGNKVSSWIVPLPIALATPREQLDAIHAQTRELKESRQALGVEMMMQVAEWTPSVLLSLGARAMSGPINTIVTNVPGPQIPLYFHGARVREIYPMVPLMEGMGLGIAVTSYAGTMNFGLNADPDIVPDLAGFTAMIGRALERIAADAGVPLSASAVAPPRRPARKATAVAPSAAGNGSAVAK
jgi:diacylglycerol O-acyltransferase / wax synthase